MPRLQEYNVQTQAAGVPDVRLARPIDVAGTGQGMQQLANAGFELANTIKKNQEQSDLSDIHVNLSKAQAEWTNSYREQLQAGTLNTEEFTQKFNEAMDKEGENVSTRAGRLYFAQASAQLKAHFLETAAVGQAELAGAKAKSNYMQSLQNGSSALINDPSSFELTNSMQKAGIENLVRSGNLPAQAAEELKIHSQNELAKSAVRGWIQLDPIEAKNQLNSGKWDAYIGGDAKHQLIAEASQADRAREVEDMRLKRQQQEVLEQQQKDTQNQFLQKIEKNELSAKEVLNSNLDPFGSGSKEQFIKLISENQRMRADKIKTNPDVFVATWDRIHLPDGDPNKLVDENDLNKLMGYGPGRGLTASDVNMLRGEMQGKKTQDGQIEAELKKGVVDIARSTLTKSNPLTGIRDPVGDVQYQKWLSGFLQDYSKQRQEGKTSSQLLDPDSPEYLGKNIRQYVRSNKQVIKDLIKTGSPSGDVAPSPTPAQVEPRKPGESAADYLKRLGK